MPPRPLGQVLRAAGATSRPEAPERPPWAQPRAASTRSPSPATSPSYRWCIADRVQLRGLDRPSLRAGRPRAVRLDAGRLGRSLAVDAPPASGRPVSQIAASGGRANAQRARVTVHSVFTEAVIVPITEFPAGGLGSAITPEAWAAYVLQHLVGRERRARVRRDADRHRRTASCTSRGSPPTARAAGSASWRRSTRRPDRRRAGPDAEEGRGAVPSSPTRSSTTRSPSRARHGRHGDDRGGRANGRPRDPQRHGRQGAARGLRPSRAARHRRGHDRLADRRRRAGRRRRRAGARRLRQPGRPHRADEGEGRQRPPAADARLQRAARRARSTGWRCGRPRASPPDTALVADPSPDRRRASATTRRSRSARTRCSPRTGGLPRDRADRLRRQRPERSRLISATTGDARGRSESSKASERSPTSCPATPTSTTSRRTCGYSPGSTAGRDRARRGRRRHGRRAGAGAVAVPACGAGTRRRRLSARGRRVFSSACERVPCPLPPSAPLGRAGRRLRPVDAGDARRDRAGAGCRRARQGERGPMAP